MLAQAAAAQPDQVYLFISLGLLALAIVLLFLELLIPSAGALAIATAVSAVASIAAMFAYDLTWGAVYLALLCAVAPLVGLGMVKLWSTTPIARRMVLDSAAGSAESRPVSVGDTGTTLTVLRPVGTVRIGQRRLDGLAEGGFIDAGRPIVVIEVVDGTAKVREAPAPRG